MKMKNIGPLFCLTVFLVSMITPTCLVFADDGDLPKYLDVQALKVVGEGEKVRFDLTNMIDKPIDIVMIIPFDFSVMEFSLAPKGIASLTEIAPLDIESFYEVYHFQFDVTCVSGSEQSEHIDFPVYVLDSTFMSILEESLRAQLEEQTQKTSVSTLVFVLSLVLIFIIGFLLGIIIYGMRARSARVRTEEKEEHPSNELFKLTLLSFSQN